MLKKCPKTGPRNRNYLFRESLFFTHASSYLRNGNDIDSDDDTVIITIITTMIMMTMTIMVQSCLLLFE